MTCAGARKGRLTRVGIGTVGRTAPVLAAKHGHVEAMQVLLAKGANVHVCTSSGGTSLMDAAQHGNVGAGGRRGGWKWDDGRKDGRIGGVNVGRDIRAHNTLIHVPLTTHDRTGSRAPSTGLLRPVDDRSPLAPRAGSRRRDRHVVGRPGRGSHLQRRVRLRRHYQRNCRRCSGRRHPDCCGHGDPDCGPSY